MPHTLGSPTSTIGRVLVYRVRVAQGFLPGFPNLHHASGTRLNVRALVVDFVLGEIVDVSVQVEVKARILKHTGEILDVKLVEGRVRHGNFPVSRRNFRYGCLEPCQLRTAVLSYHILMKLAVRWTWVVACCVAAGEKVGRLKSLKKRTCALKTNIACISQERFPTHHHRDPTGSCPILCTQPGTERRREK